jgi:hypothetical protein
MIVASRRHCFVTFLTVLFFKALEVTSSCVSVTDNERSRQFRMEKPLRGGASADSVNSKLFRRFSEDSRMPSLFSKEEDVFDKYAACLAATEGLRRIRDAEMSAEVEAQQQGNSRSKSIGEVEKHINAKYIQSSSRVLRAMGMPVSQFNDLGRVVSKDSDMKQKVSYIYLCCLL